MDHGNRRKREGIKKNIVFGLLLTAVLLLWGANGGRGISGNVYGQDQGLKYYRNFSTEEYTFQPQNWTILQDRRGLIYVANNGGVMEYDGITWKLIEIPNQVVRSLASDDSGMIYVGGIDELGYLAANAKGDTEYRSLSEYIDKDKKGFGDVWRVNATADGIFFRTSRYIFRWIPQTKKMDTPLDTQKGTDYYFTASFSCRGIYYLNQRTTGLMKYENKAFIPLRGGDFFGQRTAGRIYMVAPYHTNGESLLIGTEKQGLFLYNGGEIKPFPTKARDYLIANQGYYGTVLSGSEGEIAIATLTAGLVVIDRLGNVKYQFNKELGLLDNAVKYIFEDYQGNLWLALENGISRVEYAAPLSVFNEATGLPGKVLSVTRNSTGLYAGTNQGLFLLKPGNSVFEPVPGVKDFCWSVISYGDTVLAAADSGVYLVNTGSCREITSDTSYILQPSRQYPNIIWVGVLNTLGSLVVSPVPGSQGQIECREGPRFEKINKQIRTIAEDPDGNLWLGALPSGVFKVTFPVKDHFEGYESTYYDSSFGLPRGDIKVFRAAGHVMFGSRESSLLRFDRGKNRFIPDVSLGDEFTAGLIDVYRVLEDDGGVIWVHANGRNYRVTPAEKGDYDSDETSLARIPVAAQVNCIFRDHIENLTWFATHKGLIRFDAGAAKRGENDYYTVIRHVVVNGSPRFNNIYDTGPTPVNNPVMRNALRDFSYGDRNLRFEFYAPFFEDETRTTYSFRLEGYENQWTHRHKENFKEYTNLDAGIYQFRVKARSVYGAFGREATFRFKILPPWYLAWWAILSYILLFFLVLFLTVMWRSRKLRKEKKRLEAVVEQRTKEIHLKNQQLEKQTLQLIEQAEKLKELDHAKSRFFANISHEFRTPLTLILGPLEQVMANPLADPLRNKLNVMHLNTQRLLTLINRLLDLSRIDSGKMKLQAVCRDIIPFINGILASFENQAIENELNLEFLPAQASISLYFDSEKLEEVFTNLISNALKFTAPKGEIIVTVKQVSQTEEDFPRGYVEISVRDTGIGIPREQLAHIFDRFFQVESHEKKHKGSGIGLALTREWVLLHHGKIDVNSSIGENSGTEFILRFPLGNAHLTPQEIADSQSPEVRIPNTGQGLPPVGEECPGVHEEGGFEEGLMETPEVGTEVYDINPVGKPSPGPQKTLLVVEDSPGMRKFIRESIEGQYRVEEAEDGRLGWEKAREIMPDLIISDIMMPEMDGYELCKKLKTDLKTSHIPVILLTAKASESSQLEGLETGADDYIIKPFSMKILLTRIKNLIDLRRKLQEKIQRETLLDPEKIDISPLDKKFIRQLHDILEKNISSEDLNVEHLSEKMDISRVTLNKKIQALTGETATEFIRSFRLKRAMELLKGNFGSVMDVALEVGITNPSYFAKCFKEKFGVLPSEVQSASPE